ncbi:hypothetical protein J3458_005170 [Metarhizium acridum]|uniref:uncharacterized protein n=1 Tax=Metarhizium acridum TaxID=92637 RepID=UPI001C6BAB31|nr:hypothetical protein J3458_005170 [Metarhizium acridum]
MIRKSRGKKRYSGPSEFKATEVPSKRERGRSLNGFDPVFGLIAVLEELAGLRNGPMNECKGNVELNQTLDSPASSTRASTDERAELILFKPRPGKEDEENPSKGWDEKKEKKSKEVLEA